MSQSNYLLSHPRPGNTKQLTPNQNKTWQNKYELYSPVHAADNALFYAAQTVESGDPKFIGNVQTAADQAYRLITNGSKTKRGDYLQIERTNVIELPSDWKKSAEGKKFLEQFTNFLKRQHQGEIVTQQDIDTLKDLQVSVAGSYDGGVLTAMQNTYPTAKEMILINLDMLTTGAKKFLGKKYVPSDKENVAVQLVRGLFNYNAHNEEGQKFRDQGINSSGQNKDVTPTIIDIPHDKGL